MMQTRTKPLSREEQRKLNAYFCPRERLILRIGIQTGLRITDILALRRSDVGASVNVVERKTGKERRIYIDDGLARDMKRYGRSGDVYVFSSRDRRRKGKQITRQTVYYHFRKAMKEMRMKEGTSCHSMRKTFAVREYNRTGKDIEKVRRAMNHDRIETTVVYLLGHL